MLNICLTLSKKCVHFNDEGLTSSAGEFWAKLIWHGAKMPAFWGKGMV